MKRTTAMWLIPPLVWGLLLYHPSTSVGGAPAHVNPKVFQALEQSKGGSASFIVVLRERADLSAVATMTGKTRRIAAVTALREAARQSQAPLITLLQQMQRARQVTQFKTFFSVNALGVVGTREAVVVLAVHPAVQSIEPDSIITLEPPQVGTAEPRIDAYEWNIIKIEADRVHTELGFTGAGVTVANIDTGVRHTHEALVGNYGCDVGGPHTNCWFDAVNGMDSPYDDNNHGTHTMGTAVGSTPVNQIGVAPGAKWIACKAFNASGSGMTTWILACSDFLLAPGGDPAKAPAVINNSWGSTNFTDTSFIPMVDSWLATGVFPAFANGNSGSPTMCATTNPPGAYEQSFGTGATDINDMIASFSSRGPSQIEPFPIKPDASAPGVNVRSSIASSDTAYAPFNGTSMATPHVTGSVALLLSKSSALTVDQLKDLLTTQAEPIVDLQCEGAEGGIPNNVYGSGRINAFNAVNAAPVAGP